MDKQQTKRNISNTLYTVKRQLSEAHEQLRNAGLHGIADKVEQAFLTAADADDWLCNDINETEGPYQASLANSPF